MRNVNWHVVDASAVAAQDATDEPEAEPQLELEASNDNSPAVELPTTGTNN